MANTTFTDIAAELTAVAAKLRNSTVKVKSGSLGIGSGVIWQPDGLIITNAHVATSNKATVELSDGRVFHAIRLLIVVLGLLGLSTPIIRGRLWQICGCILVILGGRLLTVSVESWGLTL